MAYKSRSRQGGIPESPRVIAYGAPLAGTLIYGLAGDQRSTRNDYLILGFKSDPTLKYGLVPDEDDLEVFEYLPAKRAWVAHDVTFPNRAGNRTDLTDDERFQVSIDNPTECRGCHRYPDMRPNWDAYPRWPGMFGSNANLYSDVPGERAMALEEKAALKLFVEKTQFLPRLKPLDPYPYTKDVYANPPPVSYTGSETANSRITIKLGALNYTRIERIIEESPFYAKLKYAIYAGFGGCSNFASFLSDSLRSKIAVNYDQIYNETKQVMGNPLYHFGVFQHDFDSELVAVTNMRYLFEGAYGIDLDPWFMNFDQNQYRTNAQDGGMHSEVGSTLAREFYRHPKWQDFQLNMYAIGAQDETHCSALRDLSLQVQQN
jgi:hypothetical protein